MCVHKNQFVITTIDKIHIFQKWIKFNCFSIGFLGLCGVRMLIRPRFFLNTNLMIANFYILRMP